MFDKRWDDEMDRLDTIEAMGDAHGPPAPYPKPTYVVESRAVEFSEVWTPYPNPLYMTLRDKMGRIYSIMGGEVGRHAKHIHVRPNVLYDVSIQQASSSAAITWIDEVYDPKEDANSEL